MATTLGKPAGNLLGYDRRRGSPTARNLVLSALEARKRLRGFAYIAEADLKCALCGQRQELSESTNAHTARSWWSGHIQHYKGRLRVRENRAERLCSVCAVKRAA